MLFVITYVRWFDCGGSDGTLAYYALVVTSESL